jgi:hypothetical protein
MGAELFHADGWTDMTKLIFGFRYFAKKPNKGTEYVVKDIHSFISNLSDTRQVHSLFQNDSST